MACRRFAGFAGSLAVTFIKRIAIAAGALTAAASLTGCALAPPLSVEEALWFDKATGSGILGPPGLRYHEPIGYSHPGRRVYVAPPPDEP
jgi:hypothetical protein